MKAVSTELEAALGHGFATPELLVRALTHRSLANQIHAGKQQIQDGDADALPSDNERLEFLGDAVLGLVVGEALFLSHPEWQEGEFSENVRPASLVNGNDRPPNQREDLRKQRPSKPKRRILNVQNVKLRP